MVDIASSLALGCKECYDFVESEVVNIHITKSHTSNSQITGTPYLFGRSMSDMTKNDTTKDNTTKDNTTKRQNQEWQDQDWQKHEW